MKNTVATIYNPHNQSKQQLINSFVVRLKIFKRLFRELKDTKMETPEQPLLIVGQRGMGKTTLLLRLGYEIENDDTLNDWMIPIVFAEEQYGVNELYSLWEQTAKELGDKDSIFEGLAAKMDEQYVDDALEYEQVCFEILTEELRKAGKKLVLFIDNLGVLLQRFSSLEQHRLRERLLKNADIRIVGASSVVLESSFDYGDALYNFFKESHLRGLNKEETKELLLKLGEVYGEKSIQEIVEKHIGRVEALRRITGGVIRTMVLLFEIFVDSEGGRAFRDLERVIDLTTPLYKHRMDDLSTQQQKIVAAIALHWDGISTKEIAQKTRLASKKIAAQLKVLQRNDLIQRIPTQTKNNLYQLSERFFNIWYLMRFGRKIGKERVLWLVRFFEEWCDVGMLKQRVERHIDALERGGYDGQSAYNVTLALAHTKHIDWDTQDRLLKQTKAYLLDLDEELAEGLSDSDKELWETTAALAKKKEYSKMEPYLLEIHNKIYKVYLSLGISATYSKNYKKALSYTNQAIHLDVGDIHGYYLRGDILRRLQKYEEALIDYNKIISTDENSIEGHYNRGNVYMGMKNYKQAIDDYNRVVELQPNHSLAYYHRGVSYINLKNYNRGIKDLSKSIKIKPDYAPVYYNLGIAYHDIMQLESAIINYTKSIDLNPIYYNSYYSRGTACLTLKKWKEAIIDFDKAIELNSNFEMAYHNRSICYSVLNKYNKVIHDVNKIIKLNPKNSEAYHRRGNVLILYKKYDEALLDYKRAISLNPNSSFFYHSLGNLYFNLKQYKLAIHSFMNGFELGMLSFTTNTILFEDITDCNKQCLIHLIAQKEYNFLLQYFQNEKAQKLHLKDRFKPIYYALMHFQKDKYPTEYLRMPPEMKETVEEIIAKVEQMRVDYA